MMYEINCQSASIPSRRDRYLSILSYCICFCTVLVAARGRLLEPAVDFFSPPTSTCPSYHSQPPQFKQASLTPPSVESGDGDGPVVDLGVVEIPHRRHCELGVGVGYGAVARRVHHARHNAPHRRKDVAQLSRRDVVGQVGHGHAKSLCTLLFAGFGDLDGPPARAVGSACFGSRRSELLRRVRSDVQWPAQELLLQNIQRAEWLAGCVTSRQG